MFAEDNVINGMLRQAAPLHASTFAGRTGFSEVMPNPSGDIKGGWAEAHDKWARGVTADLAQAREYARAVNQNAADYVASLSQQDLEREMDLKFLPPMPLAMVLTMFVVGHYYSLAGEMSASKGVIGLQGYPF